jgi:hypothetical protein
MELLAARFLLGIYKAAEKPADKFLDAAWKPIEEAITPWFREKARIDKEPYQMTVPESKHQEAF